MGALGRCGASALLTVLLAGCGDGGHDGAYPDLLEAEARTVPLASAGPTLRGRVPASRGAAPDADPHAHPATADAGPEATVDAHGRITVPAGARWATVRDALVASARLRRECEGLEEGAQLVSLPGVDGFVIIGGTRPRDATGLDLELGTGSPASRIVARGTAWVAAHGCDATLAWDAPGRSVAPWRARVEQLLALEPGEHGIRVRAAGDVPAAEVLAHLAVVGETSLGAPHVVTQTRRRFDDHVEDSDRWLALHQAPNGAWDGAAALAWCGGHAMRDAPGWPPRENVTDAGTTGLALLAFLGAGFTNRGKHPNARVVGRGLRHLKNVQRPDGTFPGSGDWDDPVAHPIAALAMLEVYGMTGSPIYKGSAQAGLDALKPTYLRAGRELLPTILTAMAWKSAMLINKDAEKRGKPQPLRVDPTLAPLLLQDIEGVHLGTADLSAASAILARIFLDPRGPKAPGMKDGALALAEHLAKRDTTVSPTLQWIATLACFQLGGKAWKLVKASLEFRSIEAQRRDGHRCCLRGSWDPVAQPDLPGGRVSSTALHTMALQVFYRYDKVFGSR